MLPYADKFDEALINLIKLQHLGVNENVIGKRRICGRERLWNQ